jgi:acyl carrier protein
MDIPLNPENSSSLLTIQNWLIAYLAELLEIEPDDIDPKIPFERYGLDSSALVVLSGDLQEWLKRKLDPTLLYDYPTIESLAEHLAGR